MALHLIHEVRLESMLRKSVLANSIYTMITMSPCVNCVSIHT